MNVSYSTSCSFTTTIVNILFDTNFEKMSFVWESIQLKNNIFQRNFTREFIRCFILIHR